MSPTNEIELRQTITRDLRTVLTAERHKFEALFRLGFKASGRYMVSIQTRRRRIAKLMRLMEIGFSTNDHQLLDEFISEFEPTTWEYIISFVVTGLCPTRRYFVKDAIYHNLQMLRNIGSQTPV
jgi:hypothetical protein